MKKKVHAQRKFAQGAFVPVSSSERRTDLTPSKDDDKLPRPTKQLNMTPAHLLDMISMHNLQKQDTKQPIVLVERLFNQKVNGHRNEARPKQPEEKKKKAIIKMQNGHKEPSMKKTVNRNIRAVMHLRSKPGLKLKRRKIFEGVLRVTRSKLREHAVSRRAQLLQRTPPSPRAAAPPHRNSDESAAAAAGAAVRNRSPVLSGFSTDDDTPLNQISQKDKTRSGKTAERKRKREAAPNKESQTKKAVQNKDGHEEQINTTPTVKFTSPPNVTKPAAKSPSEDPERSFKKMLPTRFPYAAPPRLVLVPVRRPSSAHNVFKVPQPPPKTAKHQEPPKRAVPASPKPLANGPGGGAGADVYAFDDSEAAASAEPRLDFRQSRRRSKPALEGDQQYKYFDLPQDSSHVIQLASVQQEQTKEKRIMRARLVPKIVIQIDKENPVHGSLDKSAAARSQPPNQAARAQQPGPLTDKPTENAKRAETSKGKGPAKRQCAEPPPPQLESSVPPQPGDSGAPQPGDSGAPQPGDSGAPQPGDSGASQPGDSGAPQAGRSGEPQPGRSGEPQPGGSGEPQLGSNGEPQLGSNGEPQPGSSGEPQPGSSGEPQPGSSGEPQPGNSGELQPGSSGEPQLGSNGARPLPPAGSGAVLDAPVFYPSEAEFENPLAYLEKISPLVSKFGLCKIVPPAAFKPKCFLEDNIRFKATNQYPAKMFSRWGPATRELCAIKMHLATQGVTISRPPLVDSMEVNLPKLYHIVQAMGGLKSVIEYELWAKVAAEMNYAQGRLVEKKLDQVYVKCLLPYDTLAHSERSMILARVERAWCRRYTRMVERALRPLHKQRQLLYESSEDDDSEDDAEGGEDDALADADDCVVAGRLMSLATFEKIATNVMQMQFPVQAAAGRAPSPAEVEERYWQLVVKGSEHVCVNTGNLDTGRAGYGFTRNKGDAYSKHPWNLKVLALSAPSVLRSLGPVLSVTVPTLHLGMVFSTSCWHRDPHGLPWIEYMHSGPPKIWYGIPDEQTDKFRAAVELLCPAYCQNKAIWLPTDITMIPPPLLTDHNVSLSRTTQHPGEFIVIFPKAYSCSVCTGHTVSESVYYAPTSWLDTMMSDFEAVRASFEPTMFSCEQLLIAIVNDSRAPPFVLSTAYRALAGVVDKELELRRELRVKGVAMEVARLPKRKWNETALAECDVCRSALYLSKVSGLFRRTSTHCPQHALRILTHSPAAALADAPPTLMCFYASDALHNLMCKITNMQNQAPH